MNNKWKELCGKHIETTKSNIISFQMVVLSGDDVKIKVFFLLFNGSHSPLHAGVTLGGCLSVGELMSLSDSGYALGGIIVVVCLL